jgi:hypothetical protein
MIKNIACTVTNIMSSWFQTYNKQKTEPDIVPMEIDSVGGKMCHIYTNPPMFKLTPEKTKKFQNPFAVLTQSNQQNKNQWNCQR